MKPAKQPDPEEIQAPAVITRMHKRDREISVVAGAPKAFRRIDRLQWLRDHGSIAEHQLQAGRRLQDDWQMSKLENYSTTGMGGSGGRSNADPSDAKCDAIDRVNKAVACLPPELCTFATLFLIPEDHPFSLERCAAVVRIDRKAASFAIRTSLSILARHYGYAT